MPDIIQLTGNVGYTLTLDPSSWLFDDRKVNLDTYFSESFQEKPHPKIKKRDLLKNNYSLGVPLLPFLENAEPGPDTSELAIRTRYQTYTIPLEKAKSAILAFSKEGKFLGDDGPAHLYYGDGSNRDDPITHIVKLMIC